MDMAESNQILLHMALECEGQVLSKYMYLSVISKYTVHFATLTLFVFVSEMFNCVCFVH